MVVCHLTDGEPTPYGSRKIRLKEAETSAKVLKLDDYLILPLKNRELQDTLPARRKTAEVIRKFKPAIIFAPIGWMPIPTIGSQPVGGGGPLLGETGEDRHEGATLGIHPSSITTFAPHLRPNVQPSFIGGHLKPSTTKKSKPSAVMKANLSRSREEGLGIYRHRQPLLGLHDRD